MTLICFNHRFLFEKEDCGRRILYTGDFRLEDYKLPTLTGLHNSAGEPLKIGKSVNIFIQIALIKVGITYC